MKKLLSLLCMSSLCLTMTGQKTEDITYMEWYVPFGMVSAGRLPKGESIHSVNFKRNEWPCLFNMSDKEGSAVLTFYFEDGSTIEHKVELSPASVTVQAFHSAEYLEMLKSHRAFGVKIISDVPILPQFSSSEDGEKFGEGLFRSIGMVRLAHPGPLGRKETRWVLSDGHLSLGKGKGEDRDWFYFMNPGEKEAELVLKMVYKDKQLKKKLNVAPRSIKVFEPGSDPDILKEFQNGTTYGVVVESSVPIVMEAIRRYWNTAEQSPLNSWQFIPFAVGDMEIDHPAFW